MLSRIGDWVREGRYWRHVYTGRLIPVIAGGALPATDDFTTGPSQDLDARTNWAENSGGAGGLVITGSADAVHSVSVSENVCRWTGDTFDDDQYSEATMAGTSGSSSFIGVAVRCNTSGAGTAYYFYLSGTSGSYLQKIVTDTWTQLGSTGSNGSDAVIRIEAEGTTITPISGGSTWSSIGAQTDSSIASGSAGVSGYAEDSGHTVDDWEGGNLSSASNLTVQGADVVTQVDTAVLTKSDTLSPAGTDVVTQTDAVTLTKSDTLTANDTSVDVVTDSPVLTSSSTLTPSDASVDVATDTTALTKSDTLAPAGADVVTQTDAVTLTKSDTLAPADTFVTTQVDAVILDGAATLTPADAFVTTQTDSLTLTKSDTLSANDTSVVTVVDATVLTKSDTLAPADTFVTTQTDALALDITYILTVNDTATVTQTDTATLTKTDTLALSDAFVVTALDSPVLTGSAASLSIDDAFVGVFADNASVVRVFNTRHYQDGFLKQRKRKVMTPTPPPQIFDRPKIRRKQKVK